MEQEVSELKQKEELLVWTRLDKTSLLSSGLGRSEPDQSGIDCIYLFLTGLYLVFSDLDWTRLVDNLVLTTLMD